jgi:hypothetical protein
MVGNPIREQLYYGKYWSIFDDCWFCAIPGGRGNVSGREVWPAAWPAARRYSHRGAEWVILFPGDHFHSGFDCFDCPAQSYRAIFEEVIFNNDYFKWARI